MGRLQFRPLFGERRAGKRPRTTAWFGNGCAIYTGDKPEACETLTGANAALNRGGEQ